MHGVSKNLHASHVKHLLLLSGTHIGRKSDVPLVRNARVQKNRRPSHTKRPFLGLWCANRTFRCRVASVHQFLLSKMHAFGVEPDQKGNSVAEWRACLFFPTVKLVSFCHFWGLWHQKWTFCCRVACVHHLFLRKMQCFFPIWTLNRDSAAEWSAPFFFASVKLRRFVLISSVLGGKMFIFVKMAGNGQNLFPGGPPGVHRRAKVGNDQNRIPGELLGTSWGQLPGKVRK